MKQRITSEDIACLVPALNNILDGSYLTQIYDGMKDNTRLIIMKLRSKIGPTNQSLTTGLSDPSQSLTTGLSDPSQSLTTGLSDPVKSFENKSFTYYVLIESGIRIHTIDSFTSIRKIPSGFIGKLRKEIGDKRLYPIQQIGTDRCIDFLFSNEKHFIIEFYDRGNYILTDKDYKIIYIARSYKFQETEIDVGVIYPKDEIAKSSIPLTKDITQSKGYIIENQTFSGFPLEGKSVIEFDNILLAMHKYFTYEIKEPKKVINKKKKNLNKDEKRKMNIENQIIKLDKNKEQIINNANKLETDVNKVQQIIDIINSSILNKMSYSEIEILLKNQFTELQTINLTHEYLMLDNIKIDYTVSAYVNISKIYSENKKIKYKIERAEDVIVNIKPSKIVEPKEKLVIDRKVMKFENFWWFIYNNIIITIGKSANDNETLLNNMDPSDVLIHGHFDKSPWGIIKNPNKIEIPLKVIAYAGDFLVQRSWSWTENYANNSYYTFPNKVSKSAPSGEFMGKGSRMVHEKNFLSVANLEMGVGVIFKSGSNYLHKLDKDSQIDFAMVMCAPYISMVEFDYKVKVKPSGKKNDKGRKKLIQKMISKILISKCKSIISKDYIKIIPYEEWDKICIRTFTL